ncbi:MAG TPA: class I SAM-dependent methyltransferase [Opitutaceae bacterium]
MKLWQVRRHWDALARDDPFWAVLTESEKQGNRWAIDEFYATGVAEVEKDLAAVRSRVAPMPHRHALDFGCGAGRLTQGLARHFERVTGVDISERMVGLAREHSVEARVAFVQNARPDLGLFPDGSFDFVYSRITLQHIAPRYSRGYLREFVRVLSPGGVMSVQIPERVPAGDPPDRLKFSVWPPTMAMRISRYVRYHHPGWFPGTPKMQMYALPRDEVVSLLASAGAELVAVEASAHGEVDNSIYVARRPGP